MKKRIVYGYFFESERIFYVGLTCSPRRRHNTHCCLTGKSGSPVANYTLRTSSLPRKFILSDGFLNDFDAILFEQKMIQHYKDLGWTSLNKHKGGGLGGGDIKWTKEKCHTEALKYKSRSEFQYGSKTAYVTAADNKWLNDICQHMTFLKKQNNYWDNKTNCADVAKQYKSRSEFATKKRQAYRYALKNNWLNEFFPITSKF
jgi:hypothetical protein